MIPLGTLAAIASGFLAGLAIKLTVKEVGGWRRVADALRRRPRL